MIFIIDFDVLKTAKIKSNIVPIEVKLKCTDCSNTLILDLTNRNKISGSKINKIRNAYIDNKPINWKCPSCSRKIINKKSAETRKLRGDKFFNLTKEQKSLQVKNANITRAKNGNLGFQNFSKEQLKEINKKSLKVQKEKGIGVFDSNHQKQANKISNKSITCEKHGFIKVSFAGKCPKCLYEVYCFNREDFYNDKLELIKFENLDRIITLDEIDKINEYTGISGVWSKELEDGTVLDVAQTKDLGKEMLFSIRELNLGIKNKDLSDYDIRIKYKNSRLHKKYRDIAKEGKIIFKIISTNIEDKIERENIEMQYAYETKAKYWNPAPGQLRK